MLENSIYFFLEKYWRIPYFLEHSCSVPYFMFWIIKEDLHIIWWIIAEFHVFNCWELLKDEIYSFQNISISDIHCKWNITIFHLHWMSEIENTSMWYWTYPTVWLWIMECKQTWESAWKQQTCGFWGKHVVSEEKMWFLRQMMLLPWAVKATNCDSLKTTDDSETLLATV